MLVLTRKKDESILIGDEIEIVVLDINPSQVRLGIRAPKSMEIYRQEIFEMIKRENRQAAAAIPDLEKLKSELKGFIK